MDNKLQIFENEEFGKIRIVDIDGQPWWVLKDVCLVLGIGNSRMVSDRLDDDEKHILKSQSDLPLDIPNRGLTVITESGLYAVILRSDKPNAKAFRKWLTSEVIPSIRKNGAYLTDELLQKISEDEAVADALIDRLVNERMQNRALLEVVDELAPKGKYYDAILQCPDAILATVIAKDYGLSCVAFNKMLHLLGVQFKMGETWLLYRKHDGKGYVLTETYRVSKNRSTIHTKWTQKGRAFLYDLLREFGVLPESEKQVAH